MSDADKELVGRVVIESDAATSGAAEAVKAVGTVVDAFDEAVEASGHYTDAQGRLRESNGRFVEGAKQATTQTTALGKALAPLGVNFDKLLGKITPTNVAMLAFGVAQKAATIAVDLAVTALTAAAVAVVSLTAAGAAALTVYGQFETTFARVTTILEKGGPSARYLSDQVRDLAIALGVDAKEAAGALADAIGSGIDPTESIPFLAEALKAAKAGFAEAGPVVKAFSGIIATYGMEAKDAGHISDILFQTVKVGTTTISDLAANLGTVAPLASASGVKFEELSASIAVLTNNMFSTETAATGVRAALATILSPSAEAADKLKTLGASAADLKEVGLEEVLRRIGEATNGDAAAIAALGFETKAANALAVLAGSGFTALGKTIDAMAASAGVATDAFDLVSQTIEAQWARAVAVTEDMVLSIGQILAPFASELLAPILEFGEKSAAEFRALRDVIESMTGPIKMFGTDFQTSGGIVTMTLDLISKGLIYVSGLIDEWHVPIQMAFDLITRVVTGAGRAFEFLKSWVEFALTPIRDLIKALQALGIIGTYSTKTVDEFAIKMRFAADSVSEFGNRVAAATAQQVIHNAAIAQTNAMLAQNKAGLEAAAEAEANKTRRVQADQEAVAELLKEEEKAAEARQKIADKAAEAMAKEIEAGQKWAEQKIAEHERALRREEEAAAKAEERAARAVAANEKEAASRRKVNSEFDDYFRNFEKLIAKETGQATQVVDNRRRSSNDAGASLFGLNGPSFGFSSRPSGGSSVFGLGSFERGGRIPETGPINAHKAEFMVPAPAAATLGPSVLEAIRHLHPTQNITITGPSITVNSASSVQDASTLAKSLAPEIARVTRLGLAQAGVRF